MGWNLGWFHYQSNSVAVCISSVQILIYIFNKLYVNVINIDPMVLNCRCSTDGTDFDTLSLLYKIQRRSGLIPELTPETEESQRIRNLIEAVVPRILCTFITWKINVLHRFVQIDDELSTAPDNKAFNQAFEKVIALGKHIGFVSIEIQRWIHKSNQIKSNSGLLQQKMNYNLEIAKI